VNVNVTAALSPSTGGRAAPGSRAHLLSNRVGWTLQLALPPSAALPVAPAAPRAPSRAAGARGAPEDGLVWARRHGRVRRAAVRLGRFGQGAHGNDNGAPGGLMRIWSGPPAPLALYRSRSKKNAGGVRGFRRESARSYCSGAASAISFRTATTMRPYRVRLKVSISSVSCRRISCTSAPARALRRCNTPG